MDVFQFTPFFHLFTVATLSVERTFCFNNVKGPAFNSSVLHFISSNNKYAIRLVLRV